MLQSGLAEQPISAPYRRIDYVQSGLAVTRQTAARYPDTLSKTGFVEKHQAGRTTIPSIRLSSVC
ncbi:hypothetical protein [Paracoccus laeviglucosivorans]|uniref:hypothetical protein n=1 Tax=Paracoccus laeviglucosivorans TaxID=1197861 RepID=UPI003CCC706E